MVRLITDALNRIEDKGFFSIFTAIITCKWKFHLDILMGNAGCMVYFVYSGKMYGNKLSESLRILSLVNGNILKNYSL